MAKKRQPKAVQRGYVGPTISVGDPGLAAYLGLGGHSDAGENVSEDTALGVTAYFRGLSLIADTIGGLPLKSFRTDSKGVRTDASTFLDNPGGALLTPFQFKKLCVVHEVMHGAAYLLHVYNGAGALSSLFPVHPMMVTPSWILDEDGRVVGKRFTVRLPQGEVVLTDADMTQVLGLTLDGITPINPIAACRNALGISMAADRAAARMFSSGMLIGGLVTANETLNETDAQTVLTGLKSKLTGAKNAGDIAIVNAALTFTPWTMNAEDAQFLESRQFSVQEISRLLGVPVELLSQAGATSWGSGIQELVKGFSRFTLSAHTTPLEEALSGLLTNQQHAEFDFAGLLQGTPAEEIALLISQVEAGLLTVNEARAIRNLPPLPDGTIPPSDSTPPDSGDPEGNAQ